jgi:6-phosphogluconolactonase
VDLPPGSGPRHLLFDAKGRHAYLTLEMSAEVVMFDVQDDALPSASACR